MITIFLVFLFIIQIIGFYFLALLYTKVTKFDDLEKKQRKLMAEMDNSIGAYLSELKDENERLIEQLTIMLKSILQLTPDNELATEIIDNTRSRPVRNSRQPTKNAN